MGLGDKILNTLEGFISDENGDLIPDKTDVGKYPVPPHLQKYTIGKMCYPLDLFEENKPVGPYVMFYINVHEDSRIAKDESTNIVENLDEARARSPATRLAVSPVGFGIFQGLASSAIGGKALGFLNIGRGASGSATAVALHAQQEQNISVGAGYKRLKDAIALHMPNSLGISYKSSWKTESELAAIAALDLTQKGVDFIKGAIDNIRSDNVTGGEALSSAISDLSSKIKSASAPVAAASMSLLPGSDTLSNLSGITANPIMQSTFGGVNPRSFQMDYQFYPKSKEELKAVQNIIKTFKVHMLPEYKEGSESYLFVYPSEFDIVYYMGAETNDYVHKHTACVLTDMSINYTPGGKFNFFNSTGAPIQYNIQLSFLELDVVTREKAESGY